MHIQPTTRDMPRAAAFSGRVAAGNPLPPAYTHMRYTSRVQACLIAGAIGDALGYQVEFLGTLAEIRAQFGPDGVRNPAGPNGKLIVSDDTQMTLFTLEALLRAYRRPRAVVLDSLQQAYLDWRRTQDDDAAGADYAGTLGRFACLQVPRKPGVTCLHALQALPRPDYRPAGNDSKGCGTVMRVAPIGCFPRWLSDEDAFELGAASGAITHGHRSAQISAGAQALLIRRLVLGATLEDALRAVLAKLRSTPGSEQVVIALDKAIAAAMACPDDMQWHDDIIATLWADESLRNSTRGWVAEEALAVAVYAALAGRDLMHALRIAANHGGDSDSTAAICGNILGARDGQAAIPATLRARLDVRDAFEDLLERFAVVAELEVP